jgi:tagatose-1,6-bisphosphate aldolase non-catalytic subunit AgaZ/GatZ
VLASLIGHMQVGGAGGETGMGPEPYRSFVVARR